MLEWGGIEHNRGRMWIQLQRMNSWGNGNDKWERMDHGNGVYVCFNRPIALLQIEVYAAHPSLKYRTILKIGVRYAGMSSSQACSSRLTGKRTNWHAHRFRSMVHSIPHQVVFLIRRWRKGPLAVLTAYLGGQMPLLGIRSIRPPLLLCFHTAFRGFSSGCSRIVPAALCAALRLLRTWLGRRRSLSSRSNSLRTCTAIALALLWLLWCLLRPRTQHLAPFSVFETLGMVGAHEEMEIVLERDVETR